MNKIAFQGVVETCQTHAGRSRWSMAQLSDKQPYTPDSLTELSEMELAVFDQFILTTLAQQAAEILD